MEERRTPSPRISETIRERYPGSAGTPFLDLAKEGWAELLALLALAQPPSEYLYVDLGAGLGCNTSAEEALACTQLVG